MKLFLAVVLSILFGACLGTVENGDGEKYIELSSVDEKSYDYLVMYKIDSLSKDTSLIWEWEKGQEFDSKVTIQEKIENGEFLLLLGVKNTVVTFAKTLKFKDGKSVQEAQIEEDIIGSEFFIELKIILQPGDQQVNLGDPAQFQVNAVGKGKVSYQWYKNAEAIDGADKKLLNLSEVSKADSGSAYFVTVQDTSGNEIISETARLYVYSTEDFPVNWKLNVQSDTLGTTNPSGTITLGRDSIEVSATPKSGYFFKAWNVEVGQVYIEDPLSSTTWIKLSGGDGSIKATFSSNKTPVVSFKQPDSNSNFLKGANVPFEILASDEDGSIVSVVVYDNDNLLISLTTSPYNFAYKFDEAGHHILKAVATDDSQGSKSASTKIEVYAVPEFSETPGDLEIIKGESGSFDFKLKDGYYPDVSYSWVKLGSNPDTLSTDSIFSPSGSEYTQEGWYQLIVENDAGKLESDSLYVTILDTVKPVITLIGLDTIVLGVGQFFKDPGANALDDKDGDILIPLKNFSDDSLPDNGMGEWETRDSAITAMLPRNISYTYRVADKAGNESVINRHVYWVGWDLVGKSAISDLTDYSDFAGLGVDWDENLLLLGKNEVYSLKSGETNWSQITGISGGGPGGFLGEKGPVRIKTSPYDGIIHVSHQSSSILRSWTYSSDTWVQYFSEAIYAINGDQYYDLAISPLTGTEYYVYMQDYSLSWYQWEAIEHLYGHSISGSGYAAAAFDASDNPFMVFQNMDRDILTLAKNDTGWVTLGTALLTEASDSTRTEIYIDSSSVPYVFLHDVSSGLQPTVKYWDGVSWINISSGLPFADKADMVLDKDGMPVVASIEGGPEAGPDPAVVIHKYNGTQWEPFPSLSGEIPGFVSVDSYTNIDLVISKSNQIYLACLSPNNITVWKYSGMDR